MATKPRILYLNALGGAGGTRSAGSTDSGSQYSVENVIDGRPYTLWKGASAADNYIQVENLSPTWNIDSIGIVGHNLGTIGADVDVQRWNGSTWVAITGAGPWSPANDLPFFKAWTAGPAATGYRVNLTSMSAAPQIGVLLLGLRLEFPRFLRSGWDPTAETMQADGAFSQTGQMLGATVLFRDLNLNPSWTNLDTAWIDANFKPAWDAHLSLLKPFLWVWDYDGHPAEVYYVRLGDNPSLAMPYDPVRRSLALNLRGMREL